LFLIMSIKGCHTGGPSLTCTREKILATMPVRVKPQMVTTPSEMNAQMIFKVILII